MRTAVFPTRIDGLNHCSEYEPCPKSRGSRRPKVSAAARLASSGRGFRSGSSSRRDLRASEAQLLIDYPGLQAEDLANAWSYARAHQDEIEAEIRENEVD